MFIDKGLVGGISMIANQFARANNPDLESYDPNTQQTYLMLLDCNNQYGWAMCQYLPTGGFQWVDNVGDDDWVNKIMQMDDEGDHGFIFEVDLEYPLELHDDHDTYPLAPEHVEIKSEMLSPY